MSDYVCKDGLVYRNQFHVIFCPKYRRKVLTDGVDTRLKEILYNEAQKMNVKIKALEVMPDQVHMFIEFDPRMALHKIIKQFKGQSAHILKTEFPHLKSRIPNLWTRSYFSCSVGSVSEESVKQYILEQKHV